MCGQIDSKILFDAVRKKVKLERKVVMAAVAKVQNEARKLNHQEVVEEDKRLKLLANWEAKKARLEWKLQEEEKKEECAARGKDSEK